MKLDLGEFRLTLALTLARDDNNTLYTCTLDFLTVISGLIKAQKRKSQIWSDSMQKLDFFHLNLLHLK